MKASNLTTFSAADATTRFAELLDTALGQPVGITMDDRVTAYLVSKSAYEAMLERLENLEDQLWTFQAEVARKEGFAEQEEVEGLLRRLRNSGHENAKAK
ncbi:type II toxin-antitoxin system Phd/YefM family antitoxin [Massilia antarctica]|uniref:Antitoxin n=1 Tax=Massilia antarctica TaxID=2765360 RepID=A0AA49AAD0_9BURK|nr:type II toxin-antitoxin system Phd/YefM family antitoxin [Massilia antarctica]QPI51767.1 type II toxin-antitoxin system Phd/YefM family antitoxin [Massilia antarctica]